MFFLLCVEAEELYNHVAEIFNIWSKSQYFLKEEQNFISANEIDNMVSKRSQFFVSSSLWNTVSSILLLR